MEVDEGYFFGLGFFETISVEKGRPVFLEWHLERLVDSCSFLGITFPYSLQSVENILAEKDCPKRGALKIVVSEKNTLFFTRENPYGPKDYERGFALNYSKVQRNETSMLTYHKSLNYGDCILEKRALADTDIQEPIFLNTRGEIAEGATTNIFFVKKGRLFTPDRSCGLLPGILRRWILEESERRNEPVTLGRIRPEDVEGFDECFVTNSLLGVMPVTRLGDTHFSKLETVGRWMERYEAFVDGKNVPGNNGG